MRQLLPIVIVLALAASFACNKYPEGPGMSIRLKDRKVTGYYSITYFTVNGVDSTDVITSNPSYDCGNLDPLVFPVYDADTVVRNCKFIFHDRDWALVNDKTELELTFHYVPGGRSLYPIFFNEDRVVIWKVQRLTRYDMWLKTTLNGKEYYIRLLDVWT